MKFFYLFLTVIPFFISCSDSTNFESLDSSTTSVVNDFQNHNVYRGFDVMPANSANPYDIVGQVHNELYETYYANHSVDSVSASVEDISSRVSVIALGNEAFVSIAEPNYSFLSNDMVHYILDNIDSCTTEIIDASFTTSQAKTSINNFISSLLVLCETEDDYATIYEFVVSYEDAVIANESLTSGDKKIILITTSIARYSTEKKKRPKKNTDPEWDLMVGNIVAPIEGSNNGLGHAILLSLITGIAENQ